MSPALATHILRSTSDSLYQFPYSFRIFLGRIQFSVKASSSVVIRYLRWAKLRESLKLITCANRCQVNGLYKLFSEEENCCLCSKTIGDARMAGKAVISADVSQKLSNFLDFTLISHHLIGRTVWDKIKTVALLSIRDIMCAWNSFRGSDSLSTVRWCFHSLSVNWLYHLEVDFVLQKKNTVCH